MKIRIFLLTQDGAYAEKFADAVPELCPDEPELRSFSQISVMEEALRESHPDVILADPRFAEKLRDPPRSCELLFFVKRKGVKEVRGRRAICRYQRVTEIYREILDVLAERTAALPAGSRGDRQRILTFCSAGGGSGASTAAAACAERLAEEGEGVLYLNLEELGTAETFFRAEGEYDLGRVIYALAMDTATTPLKLESSVRREAGGVCFYSGCASALDMSSLDEEMTERLFEELAGISSFASIVVDMGFSLSEKMFRQIGRSQATVLVSDGSRTANQKLRRALEAIETAAQTRESLPLERILVLYNRFDDRTGEMIGDLAFRNLGRIRLLDGADSRELVRLLAGEAVFDPLLYGRGEISGKERRELPGKEGRR